MKLSVNAYYKSFCHLIFPHICANCNSDALNDDGFLCAECFNSLPKTGFFDIVDNPVERLFYGRAKINAAASGYYFNKHSIIQNLIFQLKYHGNKEAGHFLGRQIGGFLNKSSRFSSIDAIVPVPLNLIRERRRGYNQSLIIANGINEVFNRSVLSGLLIRLRNTETQTTKKRMARFSNMENVFEITNHSLIENKHILLIDDVLTTGATLESCSNAILAISDTQVSIATIAVAQ